MCVPVYDLDLYDLYGSLVCTLQPIPKLNDLSQVWQI